MSIRWLALDLYRCHRKVAQLERELAQAPLEQRPALQERLRRAKAEKIRMQRLLDGRIDRGIK